MNDSSSVSSGWRRYAPWLMPLLLLVLMAWRPMATPDEGRYAEVGRWMLVSGDWLVQRLNGIPFFHKPPLLYWLEASSFALFGTSVWTARLVIAAHAIGMWALLWVCARHWAGVAVARRSVWMLGGSAAFLLGGQYVNHDMLVATWIGVAIWCFARALLHEDGVHANWGRAGFVACALGVLSKGLIGLLLPGLVLFIWISWTRQWRKVWALPWFSGLALFVAIAVPWFVLAEQAKPGMLQYLFGTHQFGRFGATTFNNARSSGFYLVALLVLMFLWAFLLLLELWQRWRDRHPASADETAQAPAPWASLCWIWLVAILGFFSIPNSKLIGYALPVMPPVALLAAHAWETVLAPRRGSAGLFAAFWLTAVGLVMGAQQVVGRYSAHYSSAEIAQVLRPQVQATDTVAVLGEYPYDLPFLAQLPRPMWVLEDWEFQRQHAGDNWRRELFEGADFDAEAARVLVPSDRLTQLAQQPGTWLVVSMGAEAKLGETAARWQKLAETEHWRLYRSLP